MPIPEEQAKIKLVESLNRLLEMIALLFSNDMKSSLATEQMIGLGHYFLGGGETRKGIIFGLDIVQFGAISRPMYTGLGGQQALPSLAPDTWVITQGAIHNGTTIINIQPSDNGTNYVYAIPLEFLPEVAGCFIFGRVVLDLSSSPPVFRLKWKGKETNALAPFVAIEATTNTQLIREAFFNMNSGNNFLPLISNNELAIARILCQMPATEGQVTSWAKSEKFPRMGFGGITHPLYTQLGAALWKCLAHLNSRDIALIAPILAAITQSSTWSPDFASYWEEAQKELSEWVPYVSYYYNLIFGN